jgi:hypothetical protein
VTWEGGMWMRLGRRARLVFRVGPFEWFERVDGC